MTQGLPTVLDLAGRRAQMFPALTAHQLARVTPFGEEKTFAAGEIVFEQGDLEVPFYVVLEGELEIVHPRGQFEDPITIHGANEFTGEVTLLTDRRVLVRGRAKGALRVLRVEQACQCFICTGPDLTGDILRKTKWPLERVASAVGEGSVCIQLVHKVLSE